jgi:hypothetical protein
MCMYALLHYQILVLYHNNENTNKYNNCTNHFLDMSKNYVLQYVCVYISI